jgi:hypothetical protein
MTMRLMPLCGPACTSSLSKSSSNKVHKPTASKIAVPLMGEVHQSVPSKIQGQEKMIEGDTNGS